MVRACQHGGALQKAGKGGMPHFALYCAQLLCPQNGKRIARIRPTMTIFLALDQYFVIGLDGLSQITRFFYKPDHGSNTRIPI